MNFSFSVFSISVLNFYLFVSNSRKSQHKIQMNLQTDNVSMVFSLTHNVSLKYLPLSPLRPGPPGAPENPGNPRGPCGPTDPAGPA